MQPRDASQVIAQQFIDAGVVPGFIPGQNAVSKKYVDDQDAIRDVNIAAVATGNTTTANVINNHLSSNTAHDAQDITYSGEVATANNVKRAIDFLDSRVDNIASQSGDDITEIRDARGIYPVLSARLDASDADLNDRANKTDLVFNVKYPPPPLMGAKGDGTDDTAAIKALIALIPKSSAWGGDAGKSGGILFFPLGNYGVREQLLFEGLGVVVSGVGVESSVITALPSFTGESVLRFDQTNDGYANVGAGIENLGVYMNGVNGHGIIMARAYDGVTLNDVYVKDVADAYSGYRFIPDPDVTFDKVSQTLYLSNVQAIHKNATATGSLFYFESCQEIVLLGCKGFGTWESNGKANCYPFEFVDCQGVVAYGCSAAFSNLAGIKVRSATRPISGYVFDGWTFETIVGIIDITGTSSYHIKNVAFRSWRSAGAGGILKLDFVEYSRIESESYPITIGAGCNGVHVDCYGSDGITDSGTNTTVFAVGAANMLLQASTNIFLRASGGKNMAQFNEPPSTDTTSLLLRVNKGGFMYTSRVEVGGVDSGGTGYRILRVPNA